MKHSAYFAALILLSLLAGCQQNEKISDFKGTAYREWSRSRAKMLSSLAQDHLAGGHPDKAAQNAQEALGLDPENAEIKLLLARIFLEQARFDQAILLLGNLKDENPSSGEIHYLLGVAQEKEGLLKEALDSYHRAAELERASLAPILAATEVLIAMGRIEEAQGYLACQTVRFPPDPATMELAGRLAMMFKQYTAAMENFRLACDLDNRNLRYPELLASAQFACGEYEQAAGTLQRLLQRKDYKAQAWVYALYGDCNLTLGRLDPAEQAYQRACDIRNDQPDLWVRLAKAALAQNRLTQAIQAAQKARKLDLDNLEAGILLGYAFLEIRQPKQAVQVLTETASAHPREDLLYSLLGQAYTALGKKDLAEKCYQAALTLRPDQPMARVLAATAVTPEDNSGFIILEK